MKSCVTKGRLPVHSFMGFSLRNVSGMMGACFFNGSGVHGSSLADVFNHFSSSVRGVAILRCIDAELAIDLISEVDVHASSSIAPFAFMDSLVMAEVSFCVFEEGESLMVLEQLLPKVTANISMHKLYLCSETTLPMEL